MVKGVPESGNMGIFHEVRGKQSIRGGKSERHGRVQAMWMGLIVFDFHNFFFFFFFRMDGFCCLAIHYFKKGLMQYDN